MDSRKKIVTAQNNLKAQMHAADLLVEDFLARDLVWSADEAYPARKARYERHCSALETAGPLLPHVVMHLFAKLEERAIFEINTYAVLSQTSPADGRAPSGTQPEIVKNHHDAHQHTAKTAHSKQAKEAAKKLRPGGRHPDRLRIENEFKKLIEIDSNYFKVSEHKTSFINDMLETFPNVSKSSAYEWMKGWLSK